MKTNPDTARRGRGGFTIGEMLVAMIIISLLSMAVATGIAFAVRQYNRGLIRSESRILCSTLTSVFREELGNTTYIATSGGLRYLSKNYTPSSASSEGNQNLSYVHSVSAYADGYGQIALQTRNGSETVERLVLSPEAYVPAHKLRVKAVVSYNEAVGENGTFTVTLRVRAGVDNVDQVVSTFSVIPLNKPEDVSKSS